MPPFARGSVPEPPTTHTAAPSAWTCSNHAAPQATSAVISPLLARDCLTRLCLNYPAQYPRPTSSEDSTAPEVPVGCGQGSGGWRRRPCHGLPCRALARDLPETALHATSRHPTPRSPAAPFTCSVAWISEVVHGDVNYPSINGMQGLRVQIPPLAMLTPASVPDRTGVTRRGRRPDRGPACRWSSRPRRRGRG